MLVSAASTSRSELYTGMTTDTWLGSRRSSRSESVTGEDETRRLLMPLVRGNAWPAHPHLLGRQGRGSPVVALGAGQGERGARRSRAATCTSARELVLDPPVGSLEADPQGDARLPRQAL